MPTNGLGKAATYSAPPDESRRVQLRHPAPAPVAWRRSTLRAMDERFSNAEWLGWLDEKRIPFVMRHKENMYAFREDQAPVQLGWLARNLKRGETLNLKGGWQIGKSEREASPKVFLAIKRLKKDGSQSWRCPA